MFHRTTILAMAGFAALVLATEAQDMTWHATGTGGAVAAGAAPSVEAGLTILRDGGNAADAAAATLLALAVTDYGRYCIGGEIPLIIYDAKTNEVKTLSGVGTAPRDPATIEWFNENTIPGKGSIKATPVPGAIDLIITALRLYGTMSFEQVCEPVLTLLDKDTKGWHTGLAKTLRRLIEAEQNHRGTRDDKLQAARDLFYKGAIADELAAWYKKVGGFITKEDLAAHTTRVEDPVTVDYRGYTVVKCDTWTQGPYLLQTLRLLEGFDVKGKEHLSTDYVHLLTEALKLGLADRDEYYGDPRFAKVPMTALLSDEYTKLRRPMIDMEEASIEVRPGDPIAMKALKGPGKRRPGPGGTTTCVVADKWGNVVAATPSGNRPYAVCRELGIAHGNRLRSLNTTEGHPNRIEAGKRPRITLTPTLVLKDGKPVIAISVAGGDLQDQTTLNVLLNAIEFDMSAKDAIRSPRFATNHHQGSFDPNPDRLEAFEQHGNLILSDRIESAVREDLSKRGHTIDVTEKTVADPVMLIIDLETGVIQAAGDPQSKRHAGVVNSGQDE
jgi:gamma-glutamyltranspeptidase/glutathione hydrolase